MAGRSRERKINKIVKTMEKVKVIADIFKSAKEKGLKNVSIRIHDDLTYNYILYVGEKDRFGCRTLDLLLESLSDHEDLSYMNE